MAANDNINSFLRAKLSLVGENTFTRNESCCWLLLRKLLKLDELHAWPSELAE